MARRATAQSNTYRFFVAPECIDGADVAVHDPDLIHQIGTVLRLTPGDQVTLLDNAGGSYLVVLERVERRMITGQVVTRSPAGGETRVALTLAIGVLRPERFAWALQKGTELGVHTFVPLLCERSLNEGGRTDRWNRILREAAEQSRRGRCPAILTPIPFAQFCADLTTPGLLLWEGSGATNLRRALQSHAPIDHLTLISGSEGGLTLEELQIARRHGIMPVTLGPRTLRAETAPIVAAAATLYELGEFDLADETRSE